MKRRLPLIGLLAAVLTLAIAGCANHTHTKTVTKTQTATRTVTQTTAASSSAIPGRCTPLNTTMNCVLETQPPPSKLFSLAPGQIYGVDFGWSAVSASTAKSIGAKFGASYLSNDPSKNWTQSMVDAYHAAGLKTVAVWETSATRAEDGSAAGAADARAASAQATALGMPNDRVIEFAVDCDCSASSIIGYFQGVHAVLGARAGIYGGYDQVGAMHAAGLVGNENWQTYAWSRGLWQPASVAPLEQYLNGSTFDNDRAIAPLYGQWPAKVTPPENPHHYRWLPNTRRTFHRTQIVSGGKVHSVVHARERLAVQNWDRWGCRNPVRRNKCVDQRTHMQLLQARISTIVHKTPNLRDRATKPRWGAQHYKASDGHRTTLGGAYQQFAHRLSPKHHGVVAKW